MGGSTEGESLGHLAVTCATKWSDSMDAQQLFPKPILNESSSHHSHSLPISTALSKVLQQQRTNALRQLSPKPIQKDSRQPTPHPYCPSPSIKQSRAPNHLSSLKDRHNCDECDKSFGNISHLRRHKKIHLAERSVPCEYCGKDFSRHDVLKVRLASLISSNLEATICILRSRHN